MEDLKQRAIKAWEDFKRSKMVTDIAKIDSLKEIQSILDSFPLTGKVSTGVSAMALVPGAIKGSLKAATPMLGIGISCGAKFLSGGTGYSSFNALKTAIGPAGLGNHWHHVVEQVKIGKFGANAIHNTKNVVSIPSDIHAKISGFYSSKRHFSQGKTVRDWLSEKSFDEQYEFGLGVLDDFGVR